MKLYKNKYLIGIYAPKCDGETLLGLCDCAKEFADFIGINIDQAYVVLSKLFNKEHHFIRFLGKICSVEFIDMLEEE